MSGRAESQVFDKAVRDLMRMGLSDDAIARRTGLSLIALLEMRAAAAVEDRSPSPRRSGSGAPG